MKKKKKVEKGAKYMDVYAEAYDESDEKWKWQYDSFACLMFFFEFSRRWQDKCFADFTHFDGYQLLLWLALKNFIPCFSI